jgi:chaperonin GroES
MATRDSLAGGDRLARGARSAKFLAGGAKKTDKVVINEGIVASEETRLELDRLSKADQKALPKKEKAVMKRKPRPLYDRVVIRPIEEAEKRASLIIIAEDEANKERPREGVVVFVGKGKIDLNGNQRPMEVKPGDTVIFGQYAGTDVKIDGETVLMMREEEILAIIE